MNNFGASSYQKEERKTVGEESAKRKVASIKETDSKATGVALNKINPSFASLVLAVFRFTFGRPKVNRGVRGRAAPGDKNQDLGMDRKKKINPPRSADPV